MKWGFNVMKAIIDERNAAEKQGITYDGAYERTTFS